MSTQMTRRVPHSPHLLRPQWYRHAHAKDMPLRAIARLIQTMLYAQRFFPYYVYNILGGIEEDGEPPSLAIAGLEGKSFERRAAVPIRSCLLFLSLGAVISVRA